MRMLSELFLIQEINVAFVSEILTVIGASLRIHSIKLLAYFPNSLELDRELL